MRHEKDYSNKLSSQGTQASETQNDNNEIVQENNINKTNIHKQLPIRSLQSTRKYHDYHHNLMFNKK